MNRYLCECGKRVKPWFREGSALDSIWNMFGFGGVGECGKFWHISEKLPERCPRCGVYRMFGFSVNAVACKRGYAPEKECNDGKCRSSNSLKCNCSCGGAFHGETAFICGNQS